MAVAFGASRAVPAWNLPALQSCSETLAVGASGWTPRGTTPSLGPPYGLPPRGRLCPWLSLDPPPRPLLYRLEIQGASDVLKSPVRRSFRYEKSAGSLGVVFSLLYHVGWLTERNILIQPSKSSNCGVALKLLKRLAWLRPDPIEYIRWVDEQARLEEVCHDATGCQYGVEVDEVEVYRVSGCFQLV